MSGNGASGGRMMHQQAPDGGRRLRATFRQCVAALVSLLLLGVALGLPVPAAAQVSVAPSDLGTARPLLAPAGDAGTFTARSLRQSPENSLVSPGFGSEVPPPPTSFGPWPGEADGGLSALQAGQVGLMLAARFSKSAGPITGGLDWRIYPDRPNRLGQFRLLRESRSPTPTFVLPPGGYVVHVDLGLASAVQHIHLRRGTVSKVFELPAGGIRLEGRVGGVPIPTGQISFDIYPGSQFEPANRQAVTAHVLTGEIVMVPEGTYHFVSKYGDANAVIRSDIRVRAGRLTDVTVTHHAAIITLKLVNQRGGEALANTQWSVLTPGGDLIKESVGAFPRVILAQGDYRIVARNDGRIYERGFKVSSGVDGEIEVLAK